ncbi:Bidirectional sugar transporter SWEET1, partial [Cucurbita argyrosperma subsp. argyrosperma]
MDILFFFFGALGNATALFLFLSPIITFKRIIKSKSTEQFSGIPYVMTMLNCLLSAWYGMPFVSPHNILVTSINGTGALIEIVYVLIFIFYVSKKEKAKMGALFAIAIGAFVSVALVSVFALHGKNRKVFCGLVALVFSIIMYGSPLSIMRTVIKTKSVEFMPFFLSLFVFLCGTCWFIYGLLGHDPFLAIQSRRNISNSANSERKAMGLGRREEENFGIISLSICGSHVAPSSVYGVFLTISSSSWDLWHTSELPLNEDASFVFLALSDIRDYSQDKLLR